MWINRVARGGLLMLLALVPIACQTSCTLAGCIGGVSFETEATAEWVGSEIYRLEICIDGDCYQHDVDPNTGSTGEFFVPTATDNHPERADVTVTATTPDGTKTVASGTIVFDLFQPNGARCDPTCGSADLRVVDGEVLNTGT